MFDVLCQRYLCARRRFFALFLLAFAVMASPQCVLAGRLSLSDGWASTDSFYWVADQAVLLIAARNGSDESDFVMLLVANDGTITRITELADETHCRDSQGRFLVRLGTTDAGIVHSWTPEDGLVGPLADQSELRKCQGERSAANRRFKPRFGPQKSLARNADLWAGVVGRDADGAEILLYTETETLARWPVADQIWRDSIVIDPLFDGGFLIYPSMRADRRDDLRATTPGVPVWRVSPDATITEMTLPWADWNTEGLYRLVVTKEGLIAANLRGIDGPSPLSGLYAQTRDWQQIRTADLIPETLRVAPDQCTLAWLERDPKSSNSLAELVIEKVCDD